MRGARLLGLLVVGSWSLVGGAADASVSIAISFDDLVARSSSVGVVTPVEQRAVWEDHRIVTYTRVRVDESIAGDLGTGSEAWVATLGGIIGDVGQTVDGEPPLKIGSPALVFLKPDTTPGVRVVTARAQGYYTLKVDKSGVRRIGATNALGVLLPPQKGIQPLAGPTLLDRSTDEGAKMIREAWGRLHAK